MMELIVSMVVIATIAAVALVRFRSSSTGDYANAVGQLMISDLAFAQQSAVASAKRVDFTITPGTDSHSHEHHHGFWHDGNHRGWNNEANPHQGDNDGMANQGNNNNDDQDEGEEAEGIQGGCGFGRGHGWGFGHAHHQCGQGCGGGTQGGYLISYADNTPITFSSAQNLALQNNVTITSAVGAFYFDSTGRLVIPNYNWGASQTEVVVATINEKVAVHVARETGKVWLTSV